MATIRTLIGNIRGPQGIQGPTGATGANGQDGTNGQDGAAATIEVGSVTTVAYGSSASVVNSGTENAAVLDFQIPQGAPGEDVTDMSNLTLNDITASSADYPEFAAGETGATIFGKIKKFLSDIRTNGLFKSNLVNGFTQTTPGVNALDAAAGRSLNESLSNLTPLGTVYSGVAQNGRTISMSGNNCRGIIFGCSTVENRTFITFIYSAATGAWNHVDIQKGSNITISGDTTTTLSITSSSTVLTSCRIISWGGELTVSNPS